MISTPSSTVPSLLSDVSAGRVLIIDNYDSFTFNIREVLAEIGVDSVVVRNDEMTEEEIIALNPSHIIISPGPGTPNNPEDIGVTNAAIKYAIENGRALLGVCLGHQALAKYFGGNVVQAEEIMHGKTSTLSRLHSGKLPHADILDGVPEEFEAMRYHSLIAETESFPEALSITAQTRAGVIMALQHKEKLIYGVQFHPESFGTPEGRRILENFLRVDPAAFESLITKGIAKHEERADEFLLPDILRNRIDDTDQHACEFTEFHCELSPEQAYARLHASSDHCYLFESLDTGGGEGSHHFSYMGLNPKFVLSSCNDTFYLDDQEIDILETCGNAFDVLNVMVERMRKGEKGSSLLPKGQHLSGGFVGYMAYEAIQYQEPKALPPEGRTPKGQKTFAYGYFEDGLVYDNETHKYYYYTRGQNRSDMFQEIMSRSIDKTPPMISNEVDEVSQEEFERRVSFLREEKIRTGETFQTVISRRKIFDINGSMMPLYENLRRICPSGNMHAIKMGDAESIGSFPELILRIVEGEATTYPVAGTRSRTGDETTDAATFQGLIEDPKERAEHSMLIDLERNDLARSSVPGSVVLPKDRIMHRLDAGRVMHLASEVQSKTNGLSPLRALECVAPMGTVSGAPKVRSVEIAYALEKQARGLYAGSIGFVDIRGNLGAVVGLRAIQRQGKQGFIQAGAGIVLDSNPTEEYLETVKKMRVASEVTAPFLQTAK
ncbi:MAG TPA: chorismate-binding protein [Candidatus Peribacterales bacterium]|nr:chorismate-binding protein [Candidatus Peribacterales bacterium]